ADLWAGAEALSAPAAGTREAGVAVGNARGLAGSLARAGLEWEAEHGVRRARQSDTPTERGGADPPDMVNHARSAVLAAASGLVAGLLPFRAPPTSPCAWNSDNWLNVAGNACPGAIASERRRWQPD